MPAPEHRSKETRNPGEPGGRMAWLWQRLYAHGRRIWWVLTWAPQRTKLRQQERRERYRREGQYVGPGTAAMLAITLSASILARHWVLYHAVSFSIVNLGNPTYEPAWNDVGPLVLRMCAWGIPIIVAAGVAFGVGARKGHWWSTSGVLRWFMLFPLALLPLGCFGWALALVTLAAVYDVPPPYLSASGLAGIGLLQVALLIASHRLLRQRVRLNTESLGYCFNCGYNIAESNSSGCPECGQAPVYHHNSSS